MPTSPATAARQRLLKTEKTQQQAQQAVERAQEGVTRAQEALTKATTKAQQDVDKATAMLTRTQEALTKANDRVQHAQTDPDLPSEPDDAGDGEGAQPNVTPPADNAPGEPMAPEVAANEQGDVVPVEPT